MKLKTFLDDIRNRKNLDIYTIILIALPLAILGIIGITDLKIVASAVLAVLALVSNSLLVNRRENEEIQNNLTRINPNLDLANKFLKQEYDRTKLRHILHDSRSAFLWGPYLTTHIVILKDVIQQQLKKGLHIRFLIMEPSGIAVKSSAFQKKDHSIEELDNQIKSNLLNLKKLSLNAFPGSLEFRVIDVNPPYTIIAFDQDLPSGVMFVRLSTFRVPNELRPTFELTRVNDVNWYNFYHEQFEAAWQEAHVIDLGV